MRPDGLQLDDEGVAAMMNWQAHAAQWVVSQAIAITQIAKREELDLGDDDVLAAAIELFRMAREQEARNVRAEDA